MSLTLTVFHDFHDLECPPNFTSSLYKFRLQSSTIECEMMVCEFFTLKKVFPSPEVALADPNEISAVLLEEFSCAAFSKSLKRVPCS